MRDLMLEKLSAAVKSGSVREKESMADHTTFRVGGPADYFVIPDTVRYIGEGAFYRFDKRQNLYFEAHKEIRFLIKTQEKFRRFSFFFIFCPRTPYARQIKIDKAEEIFKNPVNRSTNYEKQKHSIICARFGGIFRHGLCGFNRHFVELH